MTERLPEYPYRNLPRREFRYEAVREYAGIKTRERIVAGEVDALPLFDDGAERGKFRLVLRRIHSVKLERPDSESGIAYARKGRERPERIDDGSSGNRIPFFPDGERRFRAERYRGNGERIEEGFHSRIERVRAYSLSSEVYRGYEAPREVERAVMTDRNVGLGGVENDFVVHDFPIFHVRSGGEMG